jgi:hypothetical protein
LKKAIHKAEGLLKKKSWAEAFMEVFAIYFVAKEEPFWFSDSDDPETVVGIVHRMDDMWEKLWARPNEELTDITEQERTWLKDAWEDFKCDIASVGYEL